MYYLNFGNSKIFVPTRKPTRKFGKKFGMQGLIVTNWLFVLSPVSLTSDNSCKPYLSFDVLKLSIISFLWHGLTFSSSWTVFVFVLIGVNVLSKLSSISDHCLLSFIKKFFCLAFSLVCTKLLPHSKQLMPIHTRRANVSTSSWLFTLKVIQLLIYSDTACLLSYHCS